MKKFFMTILLISCITIISAPIITPYQDDVNDPHKTASISTIHHV